MTKWRSDAFTPFYNGYDRLCQLPGCEAVTIARSLCWRHYQQQRRATRDWLDKLKARKLEADALKLATSSHNGYDRRFVGLFLDELSRRNSPRFPEGGWFNVGHLLHFMRSHCPKKRSDEHIGVKS